VKDNTENKQHHSKIVAAVDLGSNSFHMLIASLEENGSLRIIDKIKEMVRLGAGLDHKNRLDEETQQRALECLGRFSQRLQNIDKNDIRVTGTNTLRMAKNAKRFTKRAQQILNHHIDIISGIEEARLIYQGAIYGLAELGGKRLVIDIGGGSTELIIGENRKPIQLESIDMGCVSITKKFFSDGFISESKLKKADIYARRNIYPIRQDYLTSGWEQCVGTSGSIRSISRVLLMSGITDGTITDKGLKQLLLQILELKSVDKIKFDGLSNERRPVFLGGLIVLRAAFKVLKLKEMTVSDGSLREGLMLDMVGRIKHEDIRVSSVEHIALRYGVREQHADNVIASCEHLYGELKEPWALDDENHYLLLLWAARMHEIGLAISHSGYHKHGAYLAQNSDMPGFSLQEQQIISLLIRYHRQKFIKADFKAFSGKYRNTLFRLTIILRIAVILNRSLPDYQEPDYSIKAKKKSLTLQFPEHWFDDNPLTIADLENEIDYLDTIGFKLKIEHLK
jgi:exopolyphosphatase/guanosine-5'-triphosphate,3'-diphosphate pyrophosphatase